LKNNPYMAWVSTFLSYLLTLGHPLIFVIPAILGHLSVISGIPSSSESGQPLNAARPFTEGQSSLSSAIPSPSLFFMGSLAQKLVYPSTSYGSKPFHLLV
jgi:hypothetical protein